MNPNSPENRTSTVSQSRKEGIGNDRGLLRQASRTRTLGLRGWRIDSLAAAVLLGAGLMISSLPIFQNQPLAHGAETNPTPTPTLTPESKRIIAALENPYYWVNKDGVNKRVTRYNGTNGFGSNNPNRMVGTFEDCDYNIQTQTATNCVYFQPDETKFPETQTSTDVSITVYGIVVKRFNNTDVGFVPISLRNFYPDESNISYPRTLRIADMNNVPDYSLQSEYHEGLPQGGTYGDTFNSLSISENGSVVKLVLEIMRSQNPPENGYYESNLDNGQGTISSAFVKVASTPTPTFTPTPTATATRAAAYWVFVPVVFNNVTAASR